MKKIIKTLIVIMLLFCGHYIYGQLDMSRQNKDIEIPNTQTYDFIRYGNNVGASLYTGTVNVSIPFYTYKDKDFEIPISFDYASNGFKPNQRAGDVGLGWILNAGGCITREVRGIQDEKVELMLTPLPISPGIDIQGFLYLHKSGLNQNELIYDIFVNQSNNTFFYQYKNNELSSPKYEYEPDIFHFNFMGYYGDFHLWYNGEVKVFNTNFNANELQFNFSGVLGISTIEIKTGDGYIYYFGGSEMESEYTENTNQNSAVNERTCHTWKLYKIIAPNGRTITFKYDWPYSNYTNKIYHFHPASTHAENIFCNLGDCMNTSIHEREVKSTQMFTQPLKTIKISDDVEIEFNYEKTTGEKRLQEANNFIVNDDMYVQSYKLNKIIVKNTHENKDSIIKECNISYKLSEIHDPYKTLVTNIIYFLGQVNISGEGIYDFEYYDRTTKGFPVLGTFSVDHWGYYNGRSDYSINNFINYLNYDNYYTETIGTNLRNPNHDYVKMGMLQSITYPTGGYSLLEYEPHDYSQRVYRTASNQYIPTLLPADNNKTLTGGVRIKKISNYSDSLSMPSIKQYVYEKSTGISSGNLLNFPRYGIKYYTNCGIVQYYSLYDYFKYDGTHIEYSKVTEINADSSSVEYNFTNTENYMDYLYSLYPTYYPILRFIVNEGGTYTLRHCGITINSDIVRNMLTPVISKQPFRGKLISKNIFSNTGNLFRKETADYNYNIVHSYNVPVIVSEYYRFVTRQDLNTKLKSNTTTDYFGNSSVSNSVSYTYNTHGQVATTSRIDSKGDKIVTKQKYVTDLANPAGIYKKMLDNNVINEQIEDSVYIIKSGTTEKTLVAWRKYNYYQPNASHEALIRLQSVDEYDKKGSAWIKTATFVHDKNGRVLEKTDRNGIKTSYIWGYNGLYLVAKVDNCSLSEIKKISGLANIETTSLSTGISNYESALRSISGAEVTALEYYPFVGLKKVTDPSGKVMMYDYNATGKLRTVADDDNNLLNKYYYSTDDKN